MDHRITRESARAAKACWTDEEVANLIPPEGLTPRELVAQIGVARDKLLTPGDCLWALCDAAGVSDKTLRLFAVWCARRALSRLAYSDPRSVAVIDTAERYANGDATADELTAARDAAWDAARYAAWDAARDAARDAAWDAARDAAWDAARDAARDASMAAAWNAAWDAELTESIHHLVEMIEAE